MIRIRQFQFSGTEEHPLSYAGVPPRDFADLHGAVAQVVCHHESATLIFGMDVLQLA